MKRDLTRGIVEVSQIGKAVAAPRRSPDREVYGVSGANRRSGVGRERQTAGVDVARDQRLKARLEQRHGSILQLRDFGRILVDARHDVAEIRKTSSGYEADISRADHRDTHNEIPKPDFSRAG